MVGMDRAVVPQDGSNGKFFGKLYHVLPLGVSVWYQWVLDQTDAGFSKIYDDRGHFCLIHPGAYLILFYPNKRTPN